MGTCFQLMLLLAQEAEEGQRGTGFGELLIVILPFILIMLLFQWLFVPNPQRREQKHIEALKSTLKKNDPVVTAGGILGTVANVSPDKNEVTIKVDDNTRLRVQMRSILALPKEGDKAEAGKETKPQASSESQ